MALHHQLSSLPLLRVRRSPRRDTRHLSHACPHSTFAEQCDRDKQRKREQKRRMRMEQVPKGLFLEAKCRVKLLLSLWNSLYQFCKIFTYCRVSHCTPSLTLCFKAGETADCSDLNTEVMAKSEITLVNILPLGRGSLSKCLQNSRTAIKFINQ